MDKSRQRIKMCEKAVEMQEQHKEWVDGDVWALRQLKGYAIGIYHSSYYDEYYTNFPEKGTIYLPHQDQLQGMLIGKGIIAGDWADVLWEFVDELWGFFDEHRVGYYKAFSSTEQLWLAFVMKKRYRKIWDTAKQDWI